MTVKDCIIEGLGFLGLNNLIEKVKNDEGGVEVSALLSMAKNVIDEICCDYYPLKTSQTITFASGRYLTKNLKTPIDIYSLKVNGVSYPFTLYFDRIEADIEGSAEITYSYAAEAESMATVLPFTQKVSKRVVGYGIACEYCVINGMAEAATFDKKYRDSLKKALTKRHEKTVKARSWA